MLDFTALKENELTMSQLVSGLDPAELRRLTNEIVDCMLDLIRDWVDADVTFVPEDPEAHDAYARDEAESQLAWTLGHVIVHATASAEEAAVLAAELARGVKYHGRSRSEVPWETVVTITQCRHRLKESRRMRLASLDLWPEHPRLDNTQRFIGGREVNAVARFAWGLKHDDDHLSQIAETVRQARAACDS